MLKRLLCWFSVHGVTHTTPPDETCMVRVVCSRCGTVVDGYYEHAMGEWQPAGAGSRPCEYVRNCSRCNRRPERMQRHNWTEWAYLAEGKCDMEQHCTVCSTQARQVQHSWETRVVHHFKRDIETTRCARCGTRQP